MGTDEKTSLLSGDTKTHGAVAKDRGTRMSRFGLDVDSPGVKPTDSSIPAALSTWHRRSINAQADSANDVVVGRTGPSGDAGGMRQRKSIVQKADGTTAEYTPLEMGRHELYEEVPFVAVPGMGRKSRAISVAFSSFAAALDTKETEEYLATTGKSMTQAEKEKRTSRMSLMLLDELEADAITVTTPLIFAVAIAALSALNFGYNISVMNAPEPFVFPGHSTSAWSMAVAAFCVGGPFGATLAGKWADDKGRRGALLLNAWLFTVGGLIQALAPSLTVIIVARLIVGVASGATTVLVPIYLGEVAPPNLRGVIGTMTQFACVIGILLADIVGFPLANDKMWRYMFGLIPVMALLQISMSPLLLESPRWLLGKDPNSAKARFIIKKMRGFRYDEEVETEVEHYLGASKSQSVEDESGKKKSSGNAVAEMFADKKVRLMVISTLVLQSAQQFSGINAVFFYSGLFFNGVIENPLVGTTLMGAINVVATYFAILLMDRVGRKTLIMWSAGGMFASCVVVVLALKGFFGNMVAIGAVAAYVTFFEIGLGPIPSLIVTEMFESKYVTAAMSVSLQLNWSCNFLVSIFFPSINEALGPYSFGPFAVVLLLTFLYAWIWLPETSGTTPEELLAQLVKKNEGTTYHNVDIERASVGAAPGQDEWAKALAKLADEANV